MRAAESRRETVSAIEQTFFSEPLRRDNHLLGSCYWIVGQVCGKCLHKIHKMEVFEGFLGFYVIHVAICHKPAPKGNNFECGAEPLFLDIIN